MLLWHHEAFETSNCFSRFGPKTTAIYGYLNRLKSRASLRFGLDLEWAMIGVLVIEQAKDPFMPLDASESLL